MEHRNYKVVYRRYASLFFLVGVDSDEVGHFCFARLCSSSRGQKASKSKAVVVFFDSLSTNKQHPLTHSSATVQVTDKLARPPRRWLPCVQNELAILEFIHCVVETMDRYFGNVVSKKLHGLIHSRVSVGKQIVAMS